MYPGCHGRHLYLLRKQAELINVKIVLDYDVEVPQVYIDVNQMKQVFINVLNNALHAMEGGGKLTVSIKAAKPDGRRPWVEVSFRDTGSAFRRISSTWCSTPSLPARRMGEGTGLGLSVSQRIVEEHGGSIEVQSKLGEGSTFTIKLPTANLSAGVKRVA